MKKVSFFRVRLLLSFLILAVLNYQVKAQDPVCAPVIYSDNPLGITATGGLGETANDLWEDNCVKLKVTINDHSTNSISWSYTDACNSIANTGVEDLQSLSNVISPDVAIVVDDNNGNKVYYALMVYYDIAAGEFKFDIWKIDSGSLIFESSQTLYTPSYQPGENGIRIDANSIGDFVIVLEENDPTVFSSIPPVSTTRVIKTIAGQTASTGPVLSSNGLQDLPVTYTYTQADVALSEGDYGAARAYFAYLDVSKTIVVISWQDISDILAGTITTNNEIDRRDCDVETEEFGRPRIACSGDVNYQEDWTVVWRIRNIITGYLNILGLTYHTGDGYDHNYTNNSEEEFVTANISVPQSYDHDYPNVSYGFYNGEGNVAQLVFQGSFSGNPPNGTSNYVNALALSLDELGRVTYCSPATEPCFKLIPSGALDEDTRFPCVAGRHAYSSSYMNVAWWNVGLSEVYDKDFLWCDNTFKQGPKEKQKIKKLYVQSEPKVTIYPNPSSSLTRLEVSGFSSNTRLTCSIVDISGKKLWSKTDNKEAIEREGGKFLSALRQGLYFVRVHDSKNNSVISRAVKL